MPTPMLFSDFRLRQHNGNAVNLTIADIRVALLKASWTPAPAADTQFATITAGGKEVSGGGYLAGGAAISGSTVALDGGAAEWVHDDVIWAQNASGFADARYAVWYNAAGGRLIAYMDLGANRGNINGPLTIDVAAASGLFAF